MGSCKHKTSMSVEGCKYKITDKGGHRKGLLDLTKDENGMMLNVVKNVSATGGCKHKTSMSVEGCKYKNRQRRPQKGLLD